jgi:hypothetical protein
MTRVNLSDMKKRASCDARPTQTTKHLLRLLVRDEAYRAVSGISTAPGNQTTRLMTVPGGHLFNLSNEDVYENC